MGVLQRFERRLGGLVEGAFARVFKGAVEPVEVISALQREAGDRRRVLGEGRVLVPNRYLVELGPGDYATLSSLGPALRQEMVAGLRSSVTENGWTTYGPLGVEFAEVDDLDTGVFRVHGEVSEPQPAHPRAAAPTPAPPESADATRMIPVAAPPVERQPEPQPAGRLLDEHGRQFPLVEGTVVIGRGDEVDCSLPDTGVSRRHAELLVTRDRVVVRDLGSTNGTQVNGRRVSERALADGDEIRIGNTALTFRADG